MTGMPNAAVPAGRDPAVAALLPEARATIERVARTFALAARLLPAAVREDVDLLYLVLRTLDDLGAPDGNAFALEPSLQQSAYFRQPNRDRVVRNLYYVGGGTHPGAGLPGTLLTAEVTTNVIRADAAARRR